MTENTRITELSWLTALFVLCVVAIFTAIPEVRWIGTQAMLITMLQLVRFHMRDFSEMSENN